MPEEVQTPDIEARLAALEAKVQRLTDEIELYQLTASYGPAVDSGWAQVAADLWTEDGLYDVDVGSWEGREEIMGLINGELHQGLIERGCGHVISLPRLTIDGDTAVGTCYSRLYSRNDQGFDAWRVAANRWEFVRTERGWRIKNRVNRLLDGTSASRDLLRRSFDDANEPLDV